MPKRGDIHPVTGLIYWDTWRGVERWRDAETISRWRAKGRYYVKKWQDADLERHRASQKRFRDKHGKRRNQEFRAYRNEWKKRKRLADPLFKLNGLLSARIKKALDRYKAKKNGPSVKLVGCTISELAIHLESKFSAGMSWSNQGFWGWHIDHIIPLSSAKTVEELESLFYYTNLQPLWWFDNFAKGNKLNYSTCNQK